MAIVKEAMAAMESVMSEESIARSNEIYERELFILNLAELREQYKVKQTDMKGFSQPAISQHLATLSQAELVSSRRDGRRTYYRVSPGGLRPLVD